MQNASLIAPIVMLATAVVGLGSSFLPRLGWSVEAIMTSYVACLFGALVYALVGWRRGGGRWQPIGWGVVGVAALIVLLVLWV